MPTHLILPEDLVKAVDATAGKGKRSRFIEEAVSREAEKRKPSVGSQGNCRGSFS